MVVHLGLLFRRLLFVFFCPLFILLCSVCVQSRRNLCIYLKGTLAEVVILNELSKIKNSLDKSG